MWGADSVIWVHLASASVGDRAKLWDHQRALPGETSWGDCSGLLQLLNDRGYKGPVTAEPLGLCQSLLGLDGFAAACLTRAALQSVWPCESRVS